MEITKEYKKAKKESKRLKDEKENKIESLNKESKKVRNDFWDRERKLKDEKYKAEDKISKKRESLENEYKPLFEENYKPIEKLKRILTFLELEKDRELTFDDVRVYRDRYLEDLGYIFEDEFLNIKTFIYENDKPKNKYTLCVIGKSIFGNELVGFPYSYGLNISEDWASLRMWIKDAPTIEELKEYFKKNKEKVLFNCKTDEYFLTKEEYLSIQKDYKIEDFDEFKEFEDFRQLNDEQKKIVMDKYEKAHPGANKQIDAYDYYEENKERFNFKVLKVHNL